MAERYFKRDDAEELLPMIGHLLEQGRALKQRIEVLDQERAQAASRIMVLGGSIPPYKELTQEKAERDKLVAQMLEAVRKVQETGCLVKDLDQGLVDFPSLLEGEEVYLCWKLGEGRIEYWHGINEGFAGRKPLDDSPAEESPPGTQRIH